MKGYKTTKEVADGLNVSTARVRKMIIDGVIKAEKMGRDNFITDAEYERILNTDRPHGRPKKDKN